MYEPINSYFKDIYDKPTTQNLKKKENRHKQKRWMIDSPSAAVRRSIHIVIHELLDNFGFGTYTYQ